jgi:hypothetical protein
MTRFALVALLLVACGSDPSEPTATLTLSDTQHVLVPSWVIGCRDVTECRVPNVHNRWPTSAFDAAGSACVEGRCVLVCDQGISANCDGNINNGCEARASSCP